MHDTVDDDIDDYNSDIEDDIDYHVGDNDIDDDGCDDDGCDDDIHDEMSQLEVLFQTNSDKEELDFLFHVITDSLTCLTSLYLYVLHGTTKVQALRCHYEYFQVRLLNTARSQHYV